MNKFLFSFIALTSLAGVGYVAVVSDSSATLLSRLISPQTQRVPDEQAAVLHPIERIAYSKDWRHKTQRTAKIGGHVFVVLRTPVGSCAPIKTPAGPVKLYTFHPTILLTPSSENGQTGSFYDALIPRNSQSCALSRYVLAEWKPEKNGDANFVVGDETLKVTVKLEGTFTRAKRQLRIATTNNYLLNGHCASYCKREVELQKKYSQILRDHHVEPMQNWIGVPPISNGHLNLDDRSELGMSFRQTSMGDRTARDIGFPRATYYPDKITYLQALDATVRKEGLIGRAWVYAVDEPAVDQKLVDELAMYKLFAPSVNVMVTTNYDERLDAFVDIYAPVFNHLLSSDHPSKGAYKTKKLWSYASCMGSCGPNRRAQTDAVAERDPGPDTEIADFLIDRPAGRLFQFFEELERLNLDGALYYEATEGYPLTRDGVDLITDPWNFGGNGDGLLLYPGTPGKFGLASHQPLASFRLKLIRYAIETYW